MTEEERIVDGMTGPMRDEVLEIARNVAFMRRQLESERELIERKEFHTFIVETVGRGGDKHKVMRENKAMSGYLALFRTYVDAVGKLGAMVSDQPAPVLVQTQAPSGDSLDRMRRKFRAVSGGRAS